MSRRIFMVNTNNICARETVVLKIETKKIDTAVFTASIFIIRKRGVINRGNF